MPFLAPDPPLAAHRGDSLKIKYCPAFTPAAAQSSSRPTASRSQPRQFLLVPLLQNSFPAASFWSLSQTSRSSSEQFPLALHTCPSRILCQMPFLAPDPPLAAHRGNSLKIKCCQTFTPAASQSSSRPTASRSLPKQVLLVPLLQKIIPCRIFGPCPKPAAAHQNNFLSLTYLSFPNPLPNAVPRPRPTARSSPGQFPQNQMLSNLHSCRISVLLPAHRIPQPAETSPASPTPAKDHPLPHPSVPVPAPPHS